ncbi:coiled-coil domain-containing protein 169-like isoform X1 [Coturnix japonica]|uniref:coiled-coil domain-containing protein 169-like isoform X1 n=1 Tax=Coturnix japonica TaxID=93934 RepID=UPI000777BD80|nr:coiled-coil domain-containing protein 169-like isoform X1 [Coturnix japonica]
MSELAVKQPKKTTGRQRCLHAALSCAINRRPRESFALKTRSRARTTTAGQGGPRRSLRRPPETQRPFPGAMGERGDSEGLEMELGRERRRQQMLENSISELRKTVTELEKKLSSVEDEGNEWKTRYEMQVELNRQLQRQINILKDKVELIRGNPTDKLAIVRIFDQMPVGSLKEVLEQLKEEKKSLQNQLKDYELRLEQEAKAYHKANDERRMYLSEILQTSAMLKTAERQKPDALTSKGENQTLRLRGRCNVPQSLKMVNPQKGPIKKTAGVKQLPKLNP